METKFVARLNKIMLRPAKELGVGIALGVFSLGILAGALYLFPKVAVLGLALLGLGLPALLLLWNWPELGLLGILFLAANFLPMDVVDIRLPIGGGLELRDLLLLGLLGLLVIRGLARGTLYIPWWPVGAPLFMYLALAILSTAYALFWQGVETHWVFAELRDLLSYALFFITAWILNQRRHFVIVLAGLFAIADLTAAIIFLQQFLGSSKPLLPAMTTSFWGIWHQGGSIGSIGSVRVVPPSHVLVYFTNLIAGGLAIFSPSHKLRIMFAIHFGLLGLALLLTYTRAQWFATFIALALMLVVIVPIYKSQFTRFIFFSIPVILLACSLLGFRLLQERTEKTTLFTLLGERAMTLLTPDETLGTSSLQWRIFETEEALNSISHHPLLGVGLGNSYRDITTLQGEANGWFAGSSLAAGDVSRFTRYVHSSYLWIPVKMGIPAFVIFLWFCLAFLIAGWQLIDRLHDQQMMGIVLAVVTGFTGLLVWTVFHQHLVMNRSSTAVAFMAGLVAGIYSLNNKKHDTTFTQSSISKATGGCQ